MKEVTYEDWQKNPTPRVMWCWNSNVKDKIQAKVISVVKPVACCYPVLSIMRDDVGYDTFLHCAEIEKQRRMTNKELARWLREKPTREYKNTNNSCPVVYGEYTYLENESSDKADINILIREDDGEWREPLVEVEE